MKSSLPEDEEVFAGGGGDAWPEGSAVREGGAGYRVPGWLCRGKPT
jgi:hypothetical protein